MRAVYEVIRKPENSSMKLWFSTGYRFRAPWHFHPEIEILLVVRGRGMRYVGDSVAPFREGDLVLIGPDLPHVLISETVSLDDPRHVQCFIAQFRENFLGSDAWTTPELARVADLLRRSRRGVHFTGAVVTEAAAQLRRCVDASGTQRVAHLLLLLDLLARTPEQRLLSSADYVPKLNHSDGVRINVVCRYVVEHLTGELTQSAAAALVRMSPATFSQFFRQKMGRTFSNYVTHLRIAHALRLISDEKMNVSEACFASGFNSLSNFNRHFRALKGMSPRTYLRQLDCALPEFNG